MPRMFRIPLLLVLVLALALGAVACGDDDDDAEATTAAEATELVLTGESTTRRDFVQRYRTTMIDDALRVVDLNRDLPPEQQFAWILPG